MPRFFLLIMLIGILTGISFALPPYPPPNIAGEVTAVIDGDTIDVLLKTVPEELATELPPGTVVRIRYIGVDAPELDAEDGIVATELNEALVQGKTVYLELDSTYWDRYGRLLAYVYLDPHGYLMVNSILVAAPTIGALLYDDTPRYNALFQCLDLCGPARCYSWNEAADHVGEMVWICGVVKSVRRLDYGRVFINLGNPYPTTPRFTIMIDEDYVERFDRDPRFGPEFEQRLIGQVVYVYGEVKLYRGQPEILPTVPDQLQFEPPADCISVSCE